LKGDCDFLSTNKANANEKKAKMILVYNYNPCKFLHLISNYVPIITKITAKRVEYLLKLLATTGLDSKLKI
jgi:hypothetical protein